MYIIQICNLRGYGALGCGTFPFPDLALELHPFRHKQIETATMQTNKISSVLITVTTNHVISSPKMVPVSLSANKKVQIMQKKYHKFIKQN